MYSQNSEESAILTYFGMYNEYSVTENGIFLDIGAFDPWKFSNTRRLYELGWSGIYVEPSPTCFARFEAEYMGDPRIQLINAAVAATTGEIEFFDASGDAISTTSQNHKTKWEGAGVKYKPTIVSTIAVSELIEKYGSGVDFLSLDVEGTNFEIFNLLPDEFLNRISMICIEHDGMSQPIMSRLHAFGFVQLMHNNENLIATKPN